MAAYNDANSEMFLIELPKLKAYEVLETFHNNFDELVDNLDIQKNRLVILNPKRRTKKYSKD